MRLRVLVVAAVAVLAFPSVTSARATKTRHHAHARIVGTWTAQVSPQGEPPFQALVTFTRDGSVIETESDNPGTGQGAWKRVGPNRFAFAFQIFVFTDTGAPGGWIVVRSVVTVSGGTLSGPFRFTVYDPAGHSVQSGSGTASATRFVIPAF